MGVSTGLLDSIPYFFKDSRAYLDWFKKMPLGLCVVTTKDNHQHRFVPQEISLPCILKNNVDPRFLLENPKKSRHFDYKFDHARELVSTKERLPTHVQHDSDVLIHKPRLVTTDIRNLSRVECHSGMSS
ncbi:hypothetical protein Tco_0761308 [Tanacetum coccineum]